MRFSLRDSLATVGRSARLVGVTACLLLAAVCALGATHHPTAKTLTSRVGSVPVVVAARDLPAGQVLRAHDLAVVRWPRVAVPPGARERPGARVGQRLACPIRAGEAVTATRLVGPALTDGLPAGLSAVAVPIEAAHATELLHPGGEIELLLSPSSEQDPVLGPASNEAGSTGSVTVVGRRLLVLAVLPGDGEDPAALVVAADQPTTLAIAKAHSVGDFLAVAVSP